MTRHRNTRPTYEIRAKHQLPIIQGQFTLANVLRNKGQSNFASLRLIEGSSNTKAIAKTSEISSLREVNREIVSPTKGPLRLE